MAIYIDRPKHVHFKGKDRVFVHMVADSLEELLAFADGLGFPRRAFQDKPGKPHYDVFDEHIALVKAAGAISIGNKELVQLLHARYGG
jgi:hypothetical protein